MRGKLDLKPTVCKPKGLNDGKTNGRQTQCNANAHWKSGSRCRQNKQKGLKVAKKADQMSILADGHND